jgi:HaeII restriction endonuclease
MNTQEAKQCLDKIIDKARIHLYKPIQIAEILHYHRTVERINLLDLEIYRTPSRKWRDIICLRFLGRISTSSARYQDDVFNENAVPPKMLAKLGDINIQTNGVVEAYIYKKFAERFTQMSSGLSKATRTIVQILI